MSETEIRIPSILYETIKSDLERPHSFAWERIGFLFCKAAMDNLLLAASYQIVPDDWYLPDENVGARFDGAAIRQARQKGLETKDCIFHVHAHDGKGKPRFSLTDLQSLREVIPSFVSIVPAVPHGAILLSEDSAQGLVWQRGREPYRAKSVSIVGFHLTFL